MTTLDEVSERFLAGVHPDLVAVVRKAREATPFRLTEGMRTVARQKTLVATGKSRTMNSRHLTGHAVDVVDTAGSYAEPDMRKIAEAMKAASIELGVAIGWGGDWAKFHDPPHFELSWHEYPASTMAAKVKAAAAGFSVPAVPAVATTNVASAKSWQGFGEQVVGMGGWLLSNPVKALAVVGLAFVLGFLVPRYVAGEGE